MAKLGIVTGTIPDDGTGDTLLGGAIKINSNFDEVYNFLGDGTNLNVGVWNKTSVGINTTLKVGIGTTNPISTLTVSGNARISGATTVASVSIGNSEVISSAFQLKNIASLDATTTATIESAIALSPNTFSDIRVTGLSSFVGLSTFGNGIQVISGVSTLGNTIVGGATTQLVVNGDARITGILTIGTSSITLDGSNNQIKVGSSLTITDSGLNASGISTFNQLKVTGVSTFSNNVQIDANKALILGNSTEVQIYRYDGLPNDKTVLTATSGDFDFDTSGGGYSFGNGTYDYAVFSNQSTALYHKANDVLAVTLRYNTTDNGTEFYKDVTIRNSSGTEYVVVKTGSGSSTTEQVKVGIGTTNPTNILTVGSVGSATTNFVVNGWAEIDGVSINAKADTNLNVGKRAGFKHIGGVQNVAIGYEALYNNQQSNFNTAVGLQALVNLGNTPSSNYDGNTAIGHIAGSALQSGVQNTFIGRTSGNTITSGNNNTIVGTYDGNSNGLDIRTSSNNVVLSDGSGNIRFYANSSGNVGLGTTNAIDRLTVRDGDISVGVSTAHGVILTSPNGTKYRLIVDDAGALSTVLVP